MGGRRGEVGENPLLSFSSGTVSLRDWASFSNVIGMGND